MKTQKTASKYDYFVSGRWRNRDNIIKLADDIRKKGFSVYCFLENQSNINKVINNPEEEMKNFEKLDWRTDRYIRSIFENDMEGERNSSTFIMLLPAGKSCHIEAGIAYGLGKKCILIGDQKEAESLYLIFNEIYSNEKEFLDTI